VHDGRQVPPPEPCIRVPESFLRNWDRPAHIERSALRLDFAYGNKPFCWRSPENYGQLFGRAKRRSLMIIDEMVKAEWIWKPQEFDPDKRGPMIFLARKRVRPDDWRVWTWDDDCCLECVREFIRETITHQRSFPSMKCQAQWPRVCGHRDQRIPLRESAQRRTPVSRNPLRGAEVTPPLIGLKEEKLETRTATTPGTTPAREPDVAAELLLPFSIPTEAEEGAGLERQAAMEKAQRKARRRARREEKARRSAWLQAPAALQAKIQDQVRAELERRPRDQRPAAGWFRETNPGPAPWSWFDRLCAERLPSRLSAAAGSDDGSTDPTPGDAPDAARDDPSGILERVRGPPNRSADR
jgi:hypothetical protein